MAEPILMKYLENAQTESKPTEPNTDDDINIELSKEFLIELKNDAYHGVDSHRLRMKVFPFSLADEARQWTTPSMTWMEGTLLTTLQSGDAETWWNNEINGTTITWSKLNDKFFHQYYPLSHTCNSKIPDDLDNRTDYVEFIYWLASKFDNYWEIDKNSKNGLREFYVNERTKGTIGDLDEYKEPCEENSKKTCSDTFYKPYLDAQDAKDIYEDIDREYSSILIPARRNIDNPYELCRTEEFIVVRHSIGNDE
ncbi:hypothetical protein Tco_0386566 [Tanacetum coccineum]